MRFKVFSDELGIFDFGSPDGVSITPDDIRSYLSRYFPEVNEERCKIEKQPNGDFTINFEQEPKANDIVNDVFAMDLLDLVATVK